MNPVQKYFRAEKAESLLGIGIGLASLAFAIVLFLQRSPFYQGLGFAFLGASVIELIVCSIVVFRTPGDIIRASNKAKEIPRMETVLKSFVTYRYTEIGLAVLGAILYFLESDKSLWQGIALGLVFNGLLMLVFDFFAEKRGKVYLNYLKNNE